MAQDYYARPYDHLYDIEANAIGYINNMMPFYNLGLASEGPDWTSNERKPSSFHRV
jgi:hypothetical protein